jgi:hypothetical protein
MVGPTSEELTLVPDEVTCPGCLVLLRRAASRRSQAGSPLNS